eukprot:1112984-Amphidinium_carterae.1
MRVRRRHFALSLEDCCGLLEREFHKFMGIAAYWRGRVALNKSLMRARETVTSITYPSCPPAEIRWVVWADASLAQDQEGKSQMAWIVAKADSQLLKNHKGWIAPVAWSSHRLKRVATSTLLAELIAIAESVAEAEWLLHWEGL